MKTLQRIEALIMLHYYFKLHKNLMKTVGRVGFQNLEMSSFKKSMKIQILQKAGKCLHRRREHYAFHHCLKFENDLISGFGGVAI